MVTAHVLRFSWCEIKLRRKIDGSENFHAM